MVIVESRSARPAVELFELTPTLASAYVLRTLLTAIFDQSPDRATARTQLQGWTEQVKAAGLSCFDKFLNTLHNWHDGILNHLMGDIPTASSKGSTTNSSCSSAGALAWMTRSNSSDGCGWTSRGRAFGSKSHITTSCGLHGKSH